MIKRFISLFLSIVAISAFAGCNKLVNVPEETQPSELTIEEDLICGFFLTFEKNGEVLTDVASDNFESKDAVTFYMDKKKVEETNFEYIELISGKDVLFDCKTSSAVSDIDGIYSEKLEIEASLYYTYELAGIIMFVNPLYRNDKLNKVYAKEEGTTSGYMLSETIYSSSAGYSEEFSASRTVNGVTEELRYENRINISFGCVDKLDGVRIIEFDKNDNQISSAEIDIDEEDYTAGVECEYIIVEQNYLNKNGGQYVERTLIERPAVTETIQTLTLKKPLANGLITPVYLKIAFD